ncbi:uncharacterized protein LOC111707950 [Eurytemora carolleeae]|uniref:uncharacterized protein LOC111707950 n=1 Tax=Eurytemora carolleeae TaxID=1294199 RepID=UPI000C78FD67|nr:uncharacterized protein LOC111707950 [Eurytemora carolleeae]|eukprot:XP_023336915.1 uncharacterized protein LOC111707950 [Eurytemora affinis]
MFFLLLLLFSFTGLLQAREGSLFVLEEVPAANLNLTAHPERIPSTLLCSIKCLGGNDMGSECYVFSYDNATQTCSLGNLGELDNSEVDNTTTLVWKHKGCIAPGKNPRYGRWYCVMKIKTERCYLVCNPGYVPKSYRGLYCNFIGNRAEWGRPIKDYKCLPTIPVILGGNAIPSSNKIHTFGPDGQVQYTKGNGFHFRQFVVQFFRGMITYCGGYWVSSGCYGFNDFALGGTNLQIRIDTRIDSASVIVQDRYYIIGGDKAAAWAQAEYILEEDGLSHPGMLTPEVTEEASCAMRFTDKSFINILKETVTEYDIISGNL